MTESMGFKSQAAVNPFGSGTTAFNSSSVRFELLSHSIKESIEVVADDGLRGSRSRDISRVAQGNIKVAGDLVLTPTPAELEVFMPFILGTASSGGTYAEADTLTDMYVMLDNVSEVNTYLLRVNHAKFESAPGEKLKMTLSCVGKTMTQGAAGSFPNTVPAIDATIRPYMFYDLASGVTLSGTAYSIDKFEVTIDHMIQPTYMQGQIATDLEPTDRVIKLSLQTKYTATEQTLFNANRAGTAASGSLSFTNGTNTFSMTFAKLLAPSESVVVPGRQHLRWPVEYQAYANGSTKELVVTLPA